MDSYKGGEVVVSKVVLTNKVTRVSYGFDTDNADYLIDDESIDWGTVKGQHHTYSYPEQIGEYLSSTTIETRGISIFGWIVGTYEEIKRKKKELGRFINPQQPIEIVVGEYSIVGSPESQVKFSNSYKENNDTMCKFLISLYCNNPMFTKIVPEVTSVATVQPMFRFPLVIPTTGSIFGLKEISLFGEVVNSGAVTVGCIIELEATGIVNNPRVFKTVTGEEIKINTVMSAGDKIIISTNKGNRYIKSVIGGIEESYIEYLDFDSSWLQFDVGTTVVGYGTSANDGSTDTQETYKNLRIEISIYESVFNLEEE